jgi:NADH-quinone oxidoreductase subunit E
MTWEAKNRIESTITDDKPVLAKKVRSEIKALFKKYPSKRAALLPSLHIVQDELGFLSDQAMVEIAELLELAPAEVLDTATFYDMYTRQERGRHLIGVCESLSCELCGCEDLLQALKEKLGIEPGQTTDDKKFTLITMQCLGACDFAPAMLIDETLYKTVSVAELDEILMKVKD